MSNKKVVVVIPARNEEKYIEGTIDSLLSQSLAPKLIVVVDDGSTDKTSKFICKYKDKGVHLIIRKDRIGGPSLLGTPLMAVPFNLAFEYIEKKKVDYNFMMISGADCIYQSDYIEKLTKRLDEQQNLVIASGYQKGESINPDFARGAGRIIKRKYWEFYGGRYPTPSFLWESGVIFKAQIHGLQVKSYLDTYFESQRTSGTNIDMIEYGYMLRAIGYPLVVVLGRAARTTLKNSFKAGMRLIVGYLKEPVQKFEKDDEIREYLSKYFLVKKIKGYLRL